MEPRNELTIAAQDEGEWELSDEELDRTGPARASCPLTLFCPTTANG